jgi:tetratricopeptide (TPR) repeat protein
VPEPNPLAFYLLSVAHYQLNQTDEAILWASMAVDFSPSPQEGWLQLLAALYVQQQDYDSAAPVFEELVTLFPKREYWVQLTLIYGARESYRHSLAVQQIAYLQGFLKKGSELKRLARSYLYAELPHEAATVLEKGLEDGTIEAESEAYELLANSLIQAREFERSLVPLEQAAKLADDGKLYVRLGQVHMQREEWSEAVELFDRAVKKGGLENPGFTQLLIGISYYNDDQVNQARSSFARARKHEKTRKQADEWITHIVNEANNSG